jgi:hypothetical protein
MHGHCSMRWRQAEELWPLLLENCRRLASGAPLLDLVDKVTWF